MSQGGSTLSAAIVNLAQTLAGAIAFYTCLPVPDWMHPAFPQVARMAPVVGLLIGALLGLVDASLHQLGMPVLTRSVLVVGLWVGVTGGLHLDGAMDTADGLAVLDPQRRLAVMADSRAGAFGVMAAIALLLLKTAALTDLADPALPRPLLLALAAGWGRWGQQVAIACYPYLKPTGKGAFHKAALPSPAHTLPSLLLLLSLSLYPALANPDPWRWSLILGLGAGAIALLLPAWFHRRLGGHTGDTYGAVVEWTEALVLVLCTLA
ncbi:adenosylcobinamide-GDP ribazoletransferase [Thermoleptolyngbya sichuanensis XZ-Cy5]|uniref:adenosylcobinamide-GDP ribazoletransferase n=1 Tax=Thermoleptolyngbya sichuanensis TaxID=2885951 RepID=UPI00240E147F|nr:adenosylcobinamide-GDP ribazoletransferase [Thermoleptolyngbya sichuanensis]MDG2615432.1 adenosylcobinamide-GDP ribazoletransferase [Thermoleptolyngbya sichuanensis XZ-Cy5]